MEFAKAWIEQFQLAIRTNKSADQTLWNNWYCGNGITAHAKNVQNPKLSQAPFQKGQLNKAFYRAKSDPLQMILKSIVELTHKSYMLVVCFLFASL